MNWLIFAIKNVFRNRRRALITILITAIGTVAIMLSGGFALFTYEGLQEMAARSSGHIIVAHKDYFDQEEETPMELGMVNYQQKIEQLKEDKRVRKVLPRTALSGLISNGDKSAIFMGSGIDPEEFVVKGPSLEMVAGRRLSRNLEKLETPEIMLAKDLAKSMQVEVGGYLTVMVTTADGVLNAIDVQVSGIFSTGVPEMDKRLVMTHINTAQELLVTDKISSLHVYLYQIDDTDSVLESVQKNHKTLALQSWLEQAFFYEKVKNLYDRIFGMLGIVIFLMVFFSVSNTMSMVVVERTREIGTQAAMGAYPWEIVRNFSLESFVIGLTGTALGLLISGIISVALQFANIQMPPPPGSSHGYPLMVYFSFELAMLIVPLLILICVAAAWIAATRGVKKSIVEALAHV
ncbi:MAG: ABC transporter permease [Gammaproteobacteria bacterium]|nr:ABC transporter permease [Gammaproteobacteria bacterium]